MNFIGLLPGFPSLKFGRKSPLSFVYIESASPICFALLRQADACPLALALPRAGSSIPARIAMIAMTTRSSINVKFFFMPFLRLIPGTHSREFWFEWQIK